MALPHHDRGLSAVCDCGFLFPDNTYLLFLMTNGGLMKVESIAECWNILQYFWPALSNYRYLKRLFGLL